MNKISKAVGYFMVSASGVGAIGGMYNGYKLAEKNKCKNMDTLTSVEKSSAKKARELIWQVRGNPEFKKKARAVYQLHGSRKRPSFN